MCLCVSKLALIQAITNRMKKILFILLCFTFSTATEAQIRFEAKLDSSHILIGDQTQLHLILTQNPTWTANMPTEFELGDSIEVLDVSGIDTASTSPNLVLQKDVLITSFDSGQVRIPPIGVKFKNPTTGEYQTIYSRPVFLNVGLVEVSDSTQLKDIKGIIKEPRTFEDYIPWLIGLGVVAVLALLTWFIMKRRKREDPPPPPPVIRPAHDIALEQLHSLKGEELWQKGDIKIYQSRLTDIIREYIEKRYEVPALESTSFEIVQYLKEKDISTELKTKLREMLEIADLVKFAKAKPAQNIHEKLMEDAEDFVRTTRYIPPVEDTAQEA